MKIAIVGAGKLGRNVATALLGGDHSVTLIDTNEELLEKISSQMDVMVVHGNAKEIKILGSLTLLFKLHKPDTLKYHRLR